MRAVARVLIVVFGLVASVAMPAGAAAHGGHDHVIKLRPGQTVVGTVRISHTELADGSVTADRFVLQLADFSERRIIGRSRADLARLHGRRVLVQVGRATRSTITLRGRMRMLGRGRVAPVKASHLGQRRVLVIVGIAPTGALPSGNGSTSMLTAAMFGSGTNPGYTGRSVAEHIAGMSHGRTTITGKVLPAQRLPAGAPVCSTSITPAMYTLARQAGEEPTQWDIVVNLIQGSTCSGSGLGEVGGRNSWTWRASNLSLVPAVVAHEVGHNFGMRHANGITCTGLESQTGTCTAKEYADADDTMGTGTYNQAPTNVFNMHQQGWVDRTSVVDVTGTGGTYTLSRSDLSAGTVGLQVVSPIMPPAMVNETYGLPGVTPVYVLQYQGVSGMFSGTMVTPGVTVRAALDFGTGTVMPQRTWRYDANGSAPGVVLTGDQQFLDASKRIRVSLLAVTPTAITVKVDLSTTKMTTTTNAGTATAPVASIASRSAAGMVVAWTASTIAAPRTIGGYEVWREDAGGTRVKVAALGATTRAWSAMGLAANTAYSWTVVAVDDSGAAGARSNTATSSTDVTGPTLPGLMVTSTTAGSVSLAWSAATDPNGVVEYRVTRVVNGLATRIATLSPGTQAINATGLLENTAYTFQVQAVDGLGNVGVASSVAVRTVMTMTNAGAATPPSASIASRSATAMTIAWTASTITFPRVISGYEVWRENADGSRTKVASVGAAARAWAASGLLANTSYSWSVVAIDDTATAGARSAAATSSTDVTLPTLPGSFTATATSSRSVRLSWTASTDAGGIAEYRVLRYINGVATRIAITPGTVLSYDVAGLLPSSGYTFQVRAVDAAGNVGSLATVSIKTPA